MTIKQKTKKKKLNERGKKRLNTKLECYLGKPHALTHEISAYIYIDDYSFITPNHYSAWVSKNFVIGLYHKYKINIDFFSFIF